MVIIDAEYAHKQIVGLGDSKNALTEVIHILCLAALASFRITDFQPKNFNESSDISPILSE